MSWRHILRNALRPGFLPVMADKALTRLRDRARATGIDQATRWAREVCEDRDAWARGQDEALWQEALDLEDTVRTQGRARLDTLGQPMGGAGDVALLYLLTRLRRPAVVLETGVAAGFSSHAFLAALDANGHGHLWSSDFPYVRLPDPEALVGCVVPPDLRARWTLLLRGDLRNLRQIAGRVDAIDLFHYDSDKSYVGRARAMDIVRGALRPGATVIFDDIQDNGFFRDLVQTRGGPFHVFEITGKYVGLIPSW